MISIEEYFLGVISAFFGGGIAFFLIGLWFFSRWSEKRKIEIRKIIEETIIYGKQSGAKEIFKEIDECFDKKGNRNHNSKYGFQLILNTPYETWEKFKAEYISQSKEGRK